MWSQESARFVKPRICLSLEYQGEPDGFFKDGHMISDLGNVLMLSTL